MKIKNQYLLKFEDKKQNLNIDRGTMGVQIRGTDKITELPPLEMADIISKIDRMVLSENINKIFLASDDFSYVEKLEKHYGNRIVYNRDHHISYNSAPLHFSFHRDTINEEVLCDVAILSECPYFLYCFSSSCNL
jgi:hypothetical protein